MRFALYVIWRMVLIAFWIVTSPIWVPCGLLLVVGGAVCEDVGKWYRNVRYDWERNHASRKN